MILLVSEILGVSEVTQVFSTVFTFAAIVVALYLGLKGTKEKLSVTITNLKYDKDYKQEVITYIITNTSTVSILILYVVLMDSKDDIFDINESFAGYFISEPMQLENKKALLGTEVYPMKKIIHLPVLLAPGKAIELESTPSCENEKEFVEKGVIKFSVASGSKTFYFKKEPKTDNGWRVS